MLTERKLMQETRMIELKVKWHKTSMRRNEIVEVVKYLELKQSSFVRIIFLIIKENCQKNFIQTI